MSVLLKSVFFVCMMYSGLLQGASFVACLLVPFLTRDQCAFVWDRLKDLNHAYAHASTMLSERLHHSEAGNVVIESSFNKAYGFAEKAFSNTFRASGWLFGGAVFLKNKAGPLVNFFGKSDVQLGALALTMAGGFMYLRRQVAQVQATQGDHTTRLQDLQVSSSTIISTQSAQGKQLTGLQVSARGLHQGQIRLEGSLEAAITLLHELHNRVGENGETLENVKKSVQDLVAQLGRVEHGFGALNCNFEGLQASFNKGNEKLNWQFTSLEKMVFGLSGRVDDGFTKVDELRTLLHESVAKLRALVGEDSMSARGVIKDLQDELVRLTSALDDKATAMQQLDKNAQARDVALRKDMQSNILDLHGKLDLLIAASNLQMQTSQSYSGAVHPQNAVRLLERSGIFPSDCGQSSGFRSMAAVGPLSLTHSGLCTDR